MEGGSSFKCPNHTPSLQWKLINSFLLKLVIFVVVESLVVAFCKHCRILTPCHYPKCLNLNNYTTVCDIRLGRERPLELFGLLRRVGKAEILRMWIRKFFCSAHLEADRPGCIHWYMTCLFVSLSLPLCLSLPTLVPDPLREERRGCTHESLSLSTPISVSLTFPLDKRMMTLFGQKRCVCGGKLLRITLSSSFPGNRQTCLKFFYEWIWVRNGCKTQATSSECVLRLSPSTPLIYDRNHPPSRRSGSEDYLSLCVCALYLFHWSAPCLGILRFYSLDYNVATSKHRYVFIRTSSTKCVHLWPIKLDIVQYESERERRLFAWEICEGENKQIVSFFLFCCWWSHYNRFETFGLSLVSISM